MTNEEIDKMNAGPEMDQLIAEKVMGWDNCSEGYGRAPKFQHVEGLRDTIPPYSTSISDVWEVAEKYDYFYLFRCLRGPFEGKYECKLLFEEGPDNDKRRYYAIAEAAPLAICRAVLRSLAQK